MAQVNRSSNCYVEIPEHLLDGPKSKPEAKMQMSVNLVVPKWMDDKKTNKFISELMEDAAKEFKKYIKKRIEKEED